MLPWSERIFPFLFHGQLSPIFQTQFKHRIFSPVFPYPQVGLSVSTVPSTIPVTASAPWLTALDSLGHNKFSVNVFELCAMIGLQIPPPAKTYWELFSCRAQLLHLLWYFIRLTFCTCSLHLKWHCHFVTWNNLMSFTLCSNITASLKLPYFPR